MRVASVLSMRRILQPAPCTHNRPAGVSLRARRTPGDVCAAVAGQAGIAASSSAVSRSSSGPSERRAAPSALADTYAAIAQLSPPLTARRSLGPELDRLTALLLAAIPA